MGGWIEGGRSSSDIRNNTRGWHPIPCTGRSCVSWHHRPRTCDSGNHTARWSTTQRPRRSLHRLRCRSVRYGIKNRQIINKQAKQSGSDGGGRQIIGRHPPVRMQNCTPQAKQEIRREGKTYKKYRAKLTISSGDAHHPQHVQHGRFRRASARTAAIISAFLCICRVGTTRRQHRGVQA